MLFDLRSRGRRGAVKTIYLGLAILLFVGLVGFGIGTGVNGSGLFSAAENGTGGGSGGFAKQIAAAEKRTRRDPSDASAWKALTEAQYHELGANNEYTIPNTGVTTAKGKQYMQKVANSWNRYLELEPNHPSADLAKLVWRIFGEEGLNRPADAVRALQIVIPASEPSAALYSALAEYAFKAGDMGQGELAAGKAVSLAPKAERGLLKSRLDEVKKKVQEEKAKSAVEKAQKAAGEAGGTATPAPTTGEAGAGAPTTKGGAG